MTVIAASPEDEVDVLVPSQDFNGDVEPMEG
jgi:hypothetical protein